MKLIISWNCYFDSADIRNEMFENLQDFYNLNHEIYRFLKQEYKKIVDKK